MAFKRLRQRDGLAGGDGKILVQSGKLACNLWSLFTRLLGLNPGHHTETIKSRRSFLFMSAQKDEWGRQRTLKLGVKAEW